MNILGLEFSTPRRSVAVFNGAEVVGHASEEGTRETRAFKLIDQALQQAALGREMIECIAVGTGPGSYAGIRIAISIAQGWNLARGVKLIGISSSDAVAAQQHERGWRGTLETIIDAQRKELFSATYELDNAGWRLLAPFHLVTETQGSGKARRVRMDVLEHPTLECLVPDAATIAKVAASSTEFVAAAELSPIYVRKAEFLKAPPARFKDAS
jgi:tRNA threonylcarbamoyl adenosine modification protein YeaZ